MEGEVVQSDEVDQYADYCRARSTCPKKTVCHMCTFGDVKHRKTTFPGSEVSYPSLQYIV